MSRKNLFLICILLTLLSLALSATLLMVVLLRANLLWLGALMIPVLVICLADMQQELFRDDHDHEDGPNV